MQSGELIGKRLRTERERLRGYSSHRPRARVLMEACAIREWMARLREGVAHEVIVADPNDAPMYAQRSRGTTMDRRGALARTDPDAGAEERDRLTRAARGPLRGVP